MSGPAPVVLFGFHRSTYVCVARLLLHAKGVPYEFHDTESEMYSVEHRARHPFGRVPVLQHGDFVLYETTAIAMYIDESFAGPALLPRDPAHRAVTHQWMSCLNAYFYPSIIFALVHERLVFDELGIPADEAVITESLPKIAHCLTIMNAQLCKHPYLVNEQITMADYFSLPTITALTFVPEGKQLLAHFEAVRAWLERMSTLPAVVEFRARLPPRAPIEHARRWVTGHRAQASGPAARR